MEALEQRLKDAAGQWRGNRQAHGGSAGGCAHIAEFDYVIINDNLNEALRELNAVVLATRARWPAS